MPAKIISGTEIAQKIRQELIQDISILTKNGVRPGLCVILVGEDPASLSYVAGKEKACAEVGIHSDDNRLPYDSDEQTILDLIARKNADSKVHGILVQLPLPKHLNERKILTAIDADKDIDGFHPVNVGRMITGEKAFWPCTPHGVLKILEYEGISVKGKHVVVIGRSNIVGRPLANMLSDKKSNATVTLCHTGTPDIGYHTRQADIVIAAAGKPGVLTADMVKPGAVVIDVGVNRVADQSSPKGYRLVGDADFNGLLDVCSAVTKVPGGVGPLTITMLLYNTVESAFMHSGIKRGK